MRFIWCRVDGCAPTWPGCRPWGGVMVYGCVGLDGCETKMSKYTH